MGAYINKDLKELIITLASVIGFGDVPDKYGKRGCAWSRDFKPVKGWDADETRLYSDKPTQSYHVRQCPEFVRG